MSIAGISGGLPAQHRRTRSPPFSATPSLHPSVAGEESDGQVTAFNVPAVVLRPESSLAVARSDDPTARFDKVLNQIKTPCGRPDVTVKVDTTTSEMRSRAHGRRYRQVKKTLKSVQRLLKRSRVEVDMATSYIKKELRKYQISGSKIRRRPLTHESKRHISRHSQFPTNHNISSQTRRTASRENLREVHRKLADTVLHVEIARYLAKFVFPGEEKKAVIDKHFFSLLHDPLSGLYGSFCHVYGSMRTMKTLPDKHLTGHLRELVEHYVRTEDRLRKEYRLRHVMAEIRLLLDDTISLLPS